MEQSVETSLMPIEHESFMPALSVRQAVDRFNHVVEFVRTVMREGVDYGVIPGTDKPTLLKPGAEKLCTLFGLTSRFEIIRSAEDWTGADHNGEPFFFYLYRCRLHRGDMIIAEGDGSANSWEQKYRYREAHRKCPQCAKAAIIRGKPEFGGGWICFRKRGGCGAKFDIEDPAITDQPAGRVINENIADQVNTIQKMAQKRCLGSTTPVFIKTSRGVSRTDLDELYAIFSNGKEEVYLPGVDGTWRKVLGMIKDSDRVLFRIVLADGSSIRATAEHRFPTLDGLKSVENLRSGDSLLRSLITLGEEEFTADEDFAWVVGLFIAEGHYDSRAVKFTLHQKEIELAERISRIAARLGSRTHIHPRPSTNTLDVTVNGSAFRGLVEQFVDGAGSYQKHLSKSAWRQGARFLNSLLRGYLDGDGSWTERDGQQAYWRIGFTGRNLKLAIDLRAMAAVLGSRLMLKRGNARLKGIEYATYTGWIKEFIPKYNEKDLNKIVSIEQEARRGTVFDVEVDGDHLFCLANGIQTHNSLIAATLLAVNGSEFFTQDGEEFIINKTEIVDDVKPAPVASFTERVKCEDWLCAPAQKQMILNLLGQIITGGGTEAEIQSALLAEHGVESPSRLSPGVAPRYINCLRQTISRLKAEG